MAETTTLARPYAKAVFEFASEKNSLDGWSNMLATAAAVVELEEMSGVLSHPGLTGEQQATLVFDACQGKINDKAKNMLEVLAENKRLSLLPDIRDIFEAFKAESQKSVAVNVTSAFELEAATVEKLKQALASKLEKEVSVATETDASLVGGVVIRAGDTVIDGSIRGKLAKLADAMKA